MPETLGERDASPLQMIRADVRMNELQRWMGSRRIEDIDRAMHALLTECFGDQAPRPFRLIVPRNGRLGVLYGYGRADATALREQGVIYADPLQIQAIPLEQIQGKSMPESWRSGLQLGFETRIRPVVRRSPDWADRMLAGERDIFQMEAMQHPRGGMPRDREAVYIDWLARELDRRTGAQLDAARTRMVAFRRVMSRYHVDGSGVEGPDAVMRGTLTVTDSDAFAGLLARGVGRHRAYGYGMLLLRPARG